MVRLSILLSLFFISVSFRSETCKSNISIAFKKGEELTYRIHYGLFTAGEATLSVDKSLKSKSGKQLYNLNVKGKTTGTFAAIIKINDHWQSLVDTATLLPLQSFREIQEAKYYLKETVDFNKPLKAKVKTEKKDKSTKTKNFEVPLQVHDMVSGYYYLRSVNYNNLEIGKTVAVKAFFEDKLYDFKVKYEGKETIKTKLGKIKAIKLSPVMPNNSLFDGKDAIHIWLSDDINKIPLKIKAKMFVGAVEIEIKSQKGLRQDLKIEK
ncbi:DUF3108 domain-containing protein [Cyclobacteriaceae bacterium]|nr:DUF3108 domain-containing protein [Cyclobacteriaceae bacterium]